MNFIQGIRLSRIRIMLIAVVLASLVDADKGGHFRIAPDRDDFVSRQLYLPGTAILITRFMTPTA